MRLEPGHLFSPLALETRASVVAAVSGGGDSLALLFLLKAYLDVRAPHVSLLAVTVDHGLRAASAGEADAVAETCRIHAIAHRTMRWIGPKPSGGLIAAARDARHALLWEAAIEARADLVLTGHTRDDQAETVAMRLERSGEGGGLAGIADATLHEGSVWFCRPLLDVRRATLRNHLARLGIAWIDDPTNENFDYERARVRASLDDPGVDALVLRAKDAARARTELAARAGLLIEQHAARVAPGLFRIAPAMFEENGSGDPVVVHALRALLATVGGTPHLPDPARAGALANQLTTAGARATLSRVVVDRRRADVWLRREVRDLPSVRLHSGVQAWDGRWRIEVEQSASGLMIGPMDIGSAPAEGSEPAGAPPRLVQSALSAEPCLTHDGKSIGHPGEVLAAKYGVAAWPMVCFQTRYLPSFDLALAASLRRLLDLPGLPPAPWKDHIDADA